jgi:hypothetical protein
MSDFSTRFNRWVHQYELLTEFFGRSPDVLWEYEGMDEAAKVAHRCADNNPDALVSIIRFNDGALVVAVWEDKKNG